MKIPQQTSGHKKFIVIASIIALLILLIVGGAYIYHLGPFQSTASTINLAPATNEQKKAGTAQKQATQNNDTSQKTPTSTTPPSNTGNASSLAVTITALNQNGSLVQVRSLIETVSNSGTCTLTLTKNGVTVTKTSDIQALPSSSTCKGFDVPTSELSSGTWDVTVLVNTGNSTGTATGKITVQ